MPPTGSRWPAALHAVGLDGFAKRPIDTLSGGQMQRALFARAPLQDAPVAPLDEPFTAIDEKTVHDLMHLVGHWHVEGRTVIAVLHDLELVRRHFPYTLLLAREPVAGSRTAVALKPENLQRARAMPEAWDEHAPWHEDGQHDHAGHACTDARVFHRAVRPVRLHAARTRGSCTARSRSKVFPNGLRLVATTGSPAHRVGPLLLTATSPSSRSSRTGSRSPRTPTAARGKGLLTYMLSVQARMEREKDRHLQWGRAQPRPSTLTSASPKGSTRRRPSKASKPTFTVIEVPDMERVWLPVVESWTDWRGIIGGHVAEVHRHHQAPPRAPRQARQGPPLRRGRDRLDLLRRRAGRADPLARVGPDVSGVVMPVRVTFAGEAPVGGDGDQSGDEIVACPVEDGGFWGPRHRGRRRGTVRSSPRPRRHPRRDQRPRPGPSA